MVFIEYDFEKCKRKIWNTTRDQYNHMRNACLN